MCMAGHGRDTAGAWGPVRAEEHRGAGLAGRAGQAGPTTGQLARRTWEEGASPLSRTVVCPWTLRGEGGRGQGGQQRVHSPLVLQDSVIQATLTARPEGLYFVQKQCLPQEHL